MTNLVVSLKKKLKAILEEKRKNIFGHDLSGAKKSKPREGVLHIEVSRLSGLGFPLQCQEKCFHDAEIFLEPISSSRYGEGKVYKGFIL